MSLSQTIRGHETAPMADMQTRTITKRSGENGLSRVQEKSTQ
ncbi:hypothetical protein RESH_02155 [Rhodopirellula europaea SH398]|uniref:Uncharacterized protein n=1 Tax=Rhodopirellula europaea SH398 TaxID=1263868 RepID=M5S745_9BACT|nr:hypothetical protein RESH_02155 [Rhodopirellula europaea SH398]